MTPSQSPGPLEAGFDRRDKGWLQVDHPRIHNELRLMWRHLDSLSTGKPETGIPVSEQDERLKVAVEALERIKTLDCNNWQRRVSGPVEAAQALSRIKAMSND
jgi:hypothetical protein